MLKIAPSNQFKIERLRQVIDLLAAGKKLDTKYRDHNLIGGYVGFRECHIEPDWLLVYRIEEEELELFLFRTGTHADLFK